MNGLFGMLVLPILVTVADEKLDNVVELKKLVDITALSLKTFHKMNAGHIIYNYYGDKTGQKDHLKTFHDLLYAGKITIGKPPQPLNVFFDTSAADIMVMSAGHCRSFFMKMLSSSCWKRKYFDESRSLKDSKAVNYAWKEAVYPAFQITCDKAVMSGYLLFDIMKIADKEIPPQLFGVIEHWHYSFRYSRADGIVGFGPRKLSNFATGKPISRAHTMDQMKIKSHEMLRDQLVNVGAEKIAFHLFMNKKGKEVGHLVIGAEDDAWRRKTELQWVNMVDPDSAYWSLPMNTIKIISMGDGELTEISFSKAYSIPDPGLSLFAGPPKLIDAINEQLLLDLPVVKHNSKEGTVKFDCNYKDQLPIIAFEMNGKGFVLGPHEYVRVLSNGCTTGFMSMKNLPFFVIGDIFLRKFYTVFDMKNNKVGFAESINPLVPRE